MVLNDTRLEEWLAAIDSVLTQERLGRLDAFLTSIEGGLSTERAIENAKAVRPYLSQERAQNTGEILEKYATPERLKSVADSVAV